MGLAHIVHGSTNEFKAVSSGVGSSGTSWLGYIDTDNWVYPDRGAGYAQADALGYGHADLAKCAADAACGRYIQLPDELRLQFVMGDSTKDMSLNPVLRGDGELTYNFVSTTWTLSNMGALWLYSPYVLEGSSAYAGFNHGRTEICGPLSRTVLSGEAAKTTIDAWSHGPRIATTVAFNYSRYATEPIAATGVREIADWTLDYQLDFGGGVVFTSPCGSATDVIRAFELTDKSPFAKPAAGAAEGLLPVGTTVTGTGVDAGAYLKRIFPDGSIELSKPATATATAELTFAAVTYRTTVAGGESSRLRVQNQAGTRTVKVNKFRAEDDFEVRVHDLTHYLADANLTKTMTLNIGTDEGFLPGRLRILDVYRKNPAEKQVDPLKIVLGNCNLVPPTRLDGENANLTLPDAAHTARITVDTDTVRPAKGTYKTFFNAVAGTLVKDGVGTWPVAFTNAAAAYSGKVIIEAGTLQVLNEGATLGTVEIMAGATLVIPMTGASVAKLIVAEGAVLSGGLLTAGSVVGDPSKVEYRSGAGLIDPTASSDPLTVELTNGRMLKDYENGDSIAILVSNSVLRVNGSGVADILVVGGGGGAGSTTGAGGGGGGGVIYRQKVALRAGYYSVTVGAGGKGAVNSGREKDAQGIVTNCSFNGENSQFLDLVAFGGGAGGGFSGDGTTKRPAPFDTVGIDRGASGGSGGGGGVLYPEAGATRDRAGGAGTDGQGHAGGMSYIRSMSDAAGGGGGGAGTAAADAGKDDAGVYGSAGGDGISVPIWGNRYWGGGGAGSATANHGATFVCGGKGGGGNGRVGKIIANGDDGEPNTGGGGGASSSAGWDNRIGQRGGNGGSGIVIIRFASEQFNVKHETAIAQGGTLRRRRGHFIHTFLEDGTFTLNEGACIDLLVVGGGGGGGKSGGGGGGGGGVVVVTNIWVDAGTYAISVGAGGAGHATATATSGNGSSVDFGGFAGSYSVPGGGRGGWRNWTPPNNVGGSGGGGGSPYGATDTDTSCWSTNHGNVGVSPYGYAGGTSCGWPDPTTPGLSSFKQYACAGGGGGGAAGPGGDGWYVSQPSKTNRAEGGAGGPGVWCDFSGSMVEYGGGGAGGSAAASGNVSDAVAGADGAAGTGRGGGGASQGVDTTLNGGNGGCGCVIIRYPATDQGMLLIVR